MFIKILLLFLSMTILMSCGKKVSKSELLIKKVIKAYGGLENIKKVKSRALINLKINDYIKKNELSFVIFDDVNKGTIGYFCKDNFFSYFIDKKCYVIDDHKKVKCNKNLNRIIELGTFSNYLTNFYDIKNKNYKIKYLGKMKLHGKEVEGIRVTEKKLKVWGELYFDTENFLLHILKKGDELKIYKYDLSKRVYITSKHREINNTVYRSIVDVYENNKLIKKEIINEIMVLKKNEFSIPNSNIKIFNSPLGKKMIEKCSKINK